MREPTLDHGQLSQLLTERPSCEAGHVTAPDQCCRDVRKFLSDKPNQQGKGSRKMAAWRYQLFISSSREAEADAYQGLQDELNDLGQQGWELTAVTDAGEAKVFILKQPDEISVDPSAQA